MAVDEALLESAVAGGPCTVRWYRWERATLSLGYFQSHDAARGKSQFRELPVVRRLTGGGAIIHHHELTYSCTVPACHRLARDARALYDAVHERIIEVLTEFGFAAALRGGAGGGAGRDAAFLCFGRRDPFDVVMGDRKVLGSAQRRRKGAVLQHGSLVLLRSQWASEFPGVFDCGGHAVSVTELTDRLSAAVAGLFSARIERCYLSECEHTRAAALAADYPGETLRDRQAN